LRDGSVDPGRVVSGVPGRDFTVEDVRGSFPEKLQIRPINRPVDAEVAVPGSKSVTNRALVVAALADGTSEIRNALFSEDSYWLMDALARLGFGVRADGAKGSITVHGGGGEIPRGGVEISVGNAGTAARFLPPVLALGEGPYYVDGVPRMRERPVSDLVDAMRGLGAAVDYSGEEGRFPLTVRGGGLAGGETTVEVGKSSQFLSGLLMAAPAADAPVTLNLSGDLVSRPYVGITTGLMREFGVPVTESSRRYRIEPASYSARKYDVEPDASAASYFFAAAALTGGRISVSGLGEGCSQGDLRFVEILEKMGCAVETGARSTEVRGPDKLRGVEADMNEISDTFITLAAIAPFASTPTNITGISHTRHQETDRVSAVATELRRLGVEVEESHDSLRIIPSKLVPARILTYGDHRIAMAFSLVGLVFGGVTILDPECVTKTFPEYFARLGEL
jgi:3-phosphoshikimate 1-carboxyvinyltransferase